MLYALLYTNFHVLTKLLDLKLNRGQCGTGGILGVGVIGLDYSLREF